MVHSLLKMNGRFTNIFLRGRQINHLHTFLWTSRRNTIKYPRFFATKIINVPFMGDSISEGKILEYSKNLNDFVDIDDVVVTIETDKTSLEIRSPVKGVLKKILYPTDTMVRVDSPLFEIDTDQNDAKTGEEKSVNIEKEEKPIKKSEDKKDLASKDTVDVSSTNFGQKPSTIETKVQKMEEKTKIAKEGEKGLRSETRVPLSRIRIKIAERLKESQDIAASLTTFNSFDCTEILKMKSTYQKQFEEVTGAKLGLMSVFVKASTMALKRFPEINGYFDLQNKSIVFHDYIDISVAVAGPKGLVVPVLRNAELMSFVDIEKAIKDFALMAKEGKLKIEHMQGGTFTISNSGVYKSLIGTPIINPPQSAVLGMYGIHDTPVVINGEVKVRPVMQVALTYDHRIVDGREAILFLRAVKEYIEDPLKILLY